MFYLLNFAGKQQKSFLKNASIMRNSTGAKTSAEMTLQAQLDVDQEITSELVELVLELQRRIEMAEMLVEEFKQKQQEEYNRIIMLIVRFSFLGN
jgi:hypothetical protein